MVQIIDGKKIRDEILADVRQEVASLSFTPIFCDVLVGEDKASIQYVQMKKKTAESIGINFHNANFPITTTTEELIEEIKKINKIPNMCGIIIQLPLPENIDRRKILDAIDPQLDVDCLGAIASEKFYSGSTALGFPTALACMKLLDSTQISLKDKKTVILGQGDLVGKPVTALLKFQGLNPITIRSKTENKEELIKQADIIISGMGKGKYITGNMIKNGAVLIDAGTSESNSGIVGDIDFELVKDVASFISPVPGGVGPVTVAMLFNNVLNIAKKISQQFH
ncbi:MAG: bifunctional 5,10-methylenetetrahydrofolate dehydrogenase/5,10-methenyltetrahydrofolate cyclohydrolase [Candidatus Paceibacterota bacterium]|jgi:methylenetetrahydrofolate dehydrogenase (NADP+)/methenyltetrahydrofolate cyclohydrolase